MSANIAQHDSSSTRQFTFDLTQATIATDSNPFLGATDATASGSSTSLLRAIITDYDKAHGIIMGVTVVLLLPLAALLMRGGMLWLHATLQMFNLVLLVCGLGIGVKLAQMEGYIVSRQISRNTVANPSVGSSATATSAFGARPTFFTGTGIPTFTSSPFGPPTGFPNRPFVKRAVLPGQVLQGVGFTHIVFGIALVALFLVQPILGFIHHHRFAKTQQRGFFGIAHQWYGRMLMGLAIINGGLGLKLAGNSMSGSTAYGILAGIVTLFYLIVLLFLGRGRKTMQKDSIATTNPTRTRTALI
ncbi:hypothetical protein BP5796_13212 [Coleophoma crateriformis]|uniref:Cytochrome b561 domain-containing protein n=1 Tax=Coleophoma crateriformis TaxID=565419 RepID=A0A3D8Q3V0_9HELO|nr:hypothetical protein BP5796_13212 [Coleophoma crateriformis]